MQVYCGTHIPSGRVFVSFGPSSHHVVSSFLLLLLLLPLSGPLPHQCQYWRVAGGLEDGEILETKVQMEIVEELAESPLWGTVGKVRENLPLGADVAD